MSTERKLWLWLGSLLTVTFAVLLWQGTEVHRQAPPIPERVVDAQGAVVYTGEDIQLGRQAKRGQANPAVPNATAKRTHHTTTVG